MSFSARFSNSSYSTGLDSTWFHGSTFSSHCFSSAPIILVPASAVTGSDIWPNLSVNTPNYHSHFCIFALKLLSLWSQTHILLASSVTLAALLSPKSRQQYNFLFSPFLLHLSAMHDSVLSPQPCLSSQHIDTSRFNTLLKAAHSAPHIPPTAWVWPILGPAASWEGASLSCCCPTPLLSTPMTLSLHPLLFFSYNSNLHLLEGFVLCSFFPCWFCCCFFCWLWGLVVFGLVFF